MGDYGGYGDGENDYTNQGGFMVDSQDQGNTGYSPTKQRSNNDTIRNVNIHQLLNMATEENDEFQLDNIPLGKVVLIARILEVQKKTTQTSLKLNDTTGQIYANIWLNEGDPGALDFVEHTYVKIIGSLKSFNGRRSVTGIVAIPIEDHNVITTHKLSIVADHLRLTRSGSDSNKMNTMKSESNAMKTERPFERKFQPTKFHQDLINTMQEGQDPDIGFSFLDLCYHFGSMHSDDAIRNAVNDLIKAGSVVVTVDDDHFKYTG